MGGVCDRGAWNGAQKLPDQSCSKIRLSPFNLCVLSIPEWDAEWTFSQIASNRFGICNFCERNTDSKKLRKGIRNSEFALKYPVIFERWYEYSGLDLSGRIKAERKVGNLESSVKRKNTCSYLGDKERA